MDQVQSFERWDSKMAGAVLDGVDHDSTLEHGIDILVMVSICSCPVHSQNRHGFVSLPLVGQLMSSFACSLSGINYRDTFSRHNW